MSNFLIEVTSFLQDVDLYGVSALQDEAIEKLEYYIDSCNKAMNLDGEPLVEDSIYDYMVELLKEVKAESPVLQELWSEDSETVGSYNELLELHPMQSILTVKQIGNKDSLDFVGRMPSNANYIASYKINGHGIRVVYDDGKLVEATTRGRSTNGRDITQQMRWLLGEENHELTGYGLVEVRGELALKVDKLEDARKFTPNLKSAFSAVASLIKPSASIDEVQLLDFLAYNIFFGENEDETEFSTKEELFNFLSTSGFDIPQYSLVEGVSKEELLSTMEDVVALLEEDYEEFGYFCDGVVFEVDEFNIRQELTTEGKYSNFNIALKVGVWSQDLYSGFIKEIQWKRGKRKQTPVAVVVESLTSNEGVLTVQGNRVSNVPLYNASAIVRLGAYIGESICFRYGGEAGVVPCYPNGHLLKEEAVINLLESN